MTSDKPVWMGGGCWAGAYVVVASAPYNYGLPLAGATHQSETEGLYHILYKICL